VCATDLFRHHIHAPTAPAPAARTNGERSPPTHPLDPSSVGIVLRVFRRAVPRCKSPSSNAASGTFWFEILFPHLRTLVREREAWGGASCGSSLATPHTNLITAALERRKDGCCLGASSPKAYHDCFPLQWAGKTFGEVVVFCWQNKWQQGQGKVYTST